LRPTYIVEVHRLLARAVRRDLVRSVQQLGIDAVARDQPIKVVSPESAAFFALYT